MAPEPINVDRVYRILKREIIRGAYSLGGRIDAQAIADSVGTSITPVRDAVQRLIGEGLLESQSYGGFHAPTVTAQSLSDLYDWNDRLAQFASKLPPHPDEPLTQLLEPSSAMNEPEEFASSVAFLFLRLADRSNIRAHRRAVAQLNDVLHAARLAEAVTLRDAHGELNRLVTTLDSHHGKAISNRLSAYHQRRRRHIPEILGTIHGFDQTNN